MEWSLPTAGDAFRPTRLDSERMVRLGPGRRVDRADLARVCGTASAANQWLHKASRDGLLVPVGHGEYEVLDAPTVRLLCSLGAQAHRRLVAWATVLPRSLHPRVAFLAPRVWRDTQLRWTSPSPVFPQDAPRRTTPATLAPIRYSLHSTQTWRIRVGPDSVLEARVPSALDATILLAANLDPAWRRAAAETASALNAVEREYARRHWMRLRRYDSGHPRPTAGEQGLGVPRWWNRVHDRAADEWGRRLDVFG